MPPAQKLSEAGQRTFRNPENIVGGGMPGRFPALGVVTSIAKDESVPIERKPVQETGREVPAHIEDTVEAVARFHPAHEAEAGPLQRLVEQVTRRAGSPEFIALLTVLVFSWIALNLGLLASGRKPLDDPPFFWLQGATALTALYMTVFILTTHRREDKLAAQRDQLTLELAILSEQKSAKIIGLLEELRRDDPNISDRRDEHAEALSAPADPDAVLGALKRTQPPSR